jgi:TIGR03009 family protein
MKTAYWRAWLIASICVSLLATPLAAQQRQPGANFSDPRRSSAPDAGGRLQAAPRSDEGWQRGEEPLDPRRGAPNNAAANRQTTNQPVAQPMPPQRAPFVLSPQEQANLDQILAAWEQQSSAIKTYKCDFTRFEYAAAFGQTPAPANQPPVARTISRGELKYSAPDKGMFKVSAIEVLNPKTGKYERGGPEDLEHWVCDGKSIFEINHKEKTRTERPLPPEMRGAAISDGPLPFVFGAKAATLKQRYWMREVTPAGASDEVWLQAFPRYQADAANFKYVEVIIGRKDFMPRAIQMYNPAFNPKQGNESRTVFAFEKTSYNGRFDNVFNDFVGPDVPFHYKKIVLQPLIEQPAAANAPGARGDERAARAPGRPTAR